MVTLSPDLYGAGAAGRPGADDSVAFEHNTVLIGDPCCSSFARRVAASSIVLQSIVVATGVIGGVVAQTLSPG